MRIATRTLVYLALGAFAFCAGTAVVTAQKPDCNLAERRFDSYVSTGTKGGFTAPRWAHESLHVGLSVSAGELAHILFHRNRIASSAVGAAAVGVVPHVAARLQGLPVDPRDAVADAFLASVPLIAVTGVSAHSWQGIALAATTILGGYLAAACWASP
ncbi:MAG: hypothetical protein ACHQWU_04920 [Gemmatimonadales bacterium]